MHFLAIQAFNSMFDDDVNEVEEVIRPPLMKDLNKADVRCILRKTIDGEPSDHTDENLVAQKTRQSSIQSHREWFDPVDESQYGGLHEKYRKGTKQYYLNSRFEERIQRYHNFSFRKLEKDDRYSSDPNYKAKVDGFRDNFLRIKGIGKNKRDRKYFDRTTKPKVRKCTLSGKFVCFDYLTQKDCQKCTNSNISINPYKCREARLLFTSEVSEWTLDHV